MHNDPLRRIAQLQQLSVCGIGIFVQPALTWMAGAFSVSPIIDDQKCGPGVHDGLSMIDTMGYVPGIAVQEYSRKPRAWLREPPTIEPRAVCGHEPAIFRADLSLQRPGTLRIAHGVVNEPIGEIPKH